MDKDAIITAPHKYCINLVTQALILVTDFKHVSTDNQI